MDVFDTHAHFECEPGEIAAQLARARDAGVTRLMAVGGSSALNRGVAAAASLAEGVAVWRAIGWDRDQVAAETPPLDYAGIDAVGEIGLDYHEGDATRDAQRELFARQLETARAAGLPVVIHTREADDDTLAILREVPSRGIIHCFTGSPEFCRRLLDLGFHVSISGIVTFRLADNVRASARVVPDDRLLVETDCPFLAPVPLRGRTNEPAFVVHTLRFLAALRGIAVEALAERTSANALALLGDRPASRLSPRKGN